MKYFVPPRFTGKQSKLPLVKSVQPEKLLVLLLFEYAQWGEKVFKKKLRNFIEASKTNDASQVVAAANAITVLIKRVYNLMDRI